MPVPIRPLAAADVETVVAFSVDAWAPVFASLEAQLGDDVFHLLYPDWRAAQARAVEAVCTDEDHHVWVATVDDRPVGFVAVDFVDEDAARAGGIVMIAVDPDHQRAGVGTALAQHAIAAIEAHGADLAVIATGGDPGHAPARALYEKLGFTALPLARYYRRL